MKKQTKKIFITSQIPDAGIRLLMENFELEIYTGELPAPENLLREKIADAEVLLCLIVDNVDKSVIDQAPNLKMISNYGVGYNHIDVDYATQKGIIVTNTPGVLTDATADLTWALIMAITRQIVSGDNMVRQGKFKSWDPMLLLGADLSGRTLGIVGAGRIGRAVAFRSMGWQMNILYCSRSPQKEFEMKTGAQRVSLEVLLRESDIVSLHIPLLPETYHLIGRDELSLMKNSAFLINTARGPVVDEEALVQALRNKQIAGAALDVFENEPELTPGLIELDNIVLTPHIGSATHETRAKMAEMAAMHIIQFYKNERPGAIVNPGVWQKRRKSV